MKQMATQAGQTVDLVVVNAQVASTIQLLGSPVAHLARFLVMALVTSLGGPAGLEYEPSSADFGPTSSSRTLRWS